MSPTSTPSSRKSHTKREAHASTLAQGSRSPETIESRHQMIEVAAYYKAEHRGFQAGDPVADWLQAEMEIDAELTTVH